MGPRALTRGNSDHSKVRIFKELRCGSRATLQGSPDQILLDDLRFDQAFGFEHLSGCRAPAAFSQSPCPSDSLRYENWVVRDFLIDKFPQQSGLNFQEPPVADAIVK